MNSDPEEIFDQILAQIGGFGWYQKSRFFLLALSTCTCAFWMATIVFIIVAPPHQCQLPPKAHLPAWARNYSNIQELEKLFIPANEQCKMRNLSNHSNESQLIPCIYGWTYDSESPWTIVSEWDLVCDRNYFAHMMISISSIGVIVGVCLFSSLVDKIGRKPMFFISLSWIIGFGCISAFVQSITAYIAIATLRSMAAVPMFQVPYILSLEMVSKDKNTFVINVMSIVFALGAALMALFAWFCQTWQQMVLINSCTFIFVYSYWFLVDESPRWLITKGSHGKALTILAKMAKCNEKSLQIDGLREILINSKCHKQQPSGSVKTWALFQSWNLATASLVVAFIWCANSLIYAGINYNVENLGGNQHLVFALVCLIEIPACFFNFVVNVAGRIWPSALTMGISGLCLLAASLTPEHLSWIIALLTIVSKFCIAASYCTVHLLGGELFPTELRATGLGFATMCSHVFGMVTPFVIYSAKVFRILPMLIMGSVALLAGATTLFLPETLHRALPDTVEDTKKVPGFGLKSFWANITCRRFRNHPSNLNTYELK